MEESSKAHTNLEFELPPPPKRSDQEHIWVGPCGIQLANNMIVKSEESRKLVSCRTIETFGRDTPFSWILPVKIEKRMHPEYDTGEAPPRA